MKQWWLLTVLVFALTGCYAQRMELVDPMGFSLNPQQIRVSVQSQTESDLAFKLQQHLTRLLPRERGVDVVDASTTGVWTLQIQLSSKQLLAEAPDFLLTGQPASARLHVQYDLAVDLVDPDQQVKTHWDLTQSGDAQIEAFAQLQHELLDRLIARTIQSLQPHYEYF